MRSLILGVLVCVGCSSSGGDDGEEVVDCAKNIGQDDFVIGLEKVGMANKLDFKLLASDHFPQEPGDNEWTLLISTMQGGPVAGPLTGATLSVSPFMPKHGHYAPKDVIVTPLTEAGQYKLSEINTWMPGLWETTIENRGADGDKVVFK